MWFDIAPILWKIATIVRARPTYNGTRSQFCRVDTIWIVAPARSLNPLKEGPLARHAPELFITIL
jgi:hypothetical protein